MQKKTITWFVVAFIVGSFIFWQADKACSSPKKNAFSYSYDIEDILESGGWDSADADDSGNISVRKNRPEEKHQLNVLSVDFESDMDGISAVCENGNACITSTVREEEQKQSSLILHPGSGKGLLQVFLNYKKAVAAELAE